MAYPLVFFVKVCYNIDRYPHSFCRRKIMKRHIGILLLICLLASTLPACSDADAGNDFTAVTSAEETTVPETTEADVYAALLADVPKEDYDGYTFLMLNNESNFAYTLMTAEELNGEGINDAIYNRNVTVCGDLNIKIEENMVSYSQVTKDMQTSIAAGDDTYSCFWNESQFVAPFAISGQLLNIHDISAIDLTKPWWNGNALSDVEIGNYQYFLVGDLHLMFKESFWMCGFNKDIVDENGLEDPYEKVREGAWTLDEMQHYMATAAQDLNGDGVMDGDDRFGVTCYDGCIRALAIAADELFIARDEDGIPQVVVPDDRFYSVYEKIVSVLFDSSVDYVCYSGKTKNIDQYENGWHGVFSSGHALFYLEPIGSLKKLRDMDAEFGIIPFPKYDKEQENYITYIAAYAAFCGIPITASDMQRTGVILENLCAQSYGELRQAYVDTTLNFKYIRDAESAEMLNLILDSGRFSLTDTLAVSAPISTYTTNAQAAKGELASAYAKIIESSQKQLAENVEKLLKGN